MPPQSPQYTQNVKEQFPNANLKVGWPKKLFTFALLIFISIFLIYAGLAFGYKAFLRGSIGDMETELDRLSSQISKEQKENLATLYSQIVNMRGLLQDHVFSSYAMDFLESITDQSVVYEDMSLSSEDREIAINGVAANYETLVSQLTLLEESDQVEKYNLENSEFDNGLVRFRLSITTVEDLFKPDL